MLFLFAGKAHPADEPAQWMMREIQRISSQPPFIGKILLLEGYDMGISRLLVPASTSGSTLRCTRSRRAARRA